MKSTSTRTQRDVVNWLLDMHRAGFIKKDKKVKNRYFRSK